MHQTVGKDIFGGHPALDVSLECEYCTYHADDVTVVGNTEAQIETDGQSLYSPQYVILSRLSITCFKWVRTVYNSVYYFD